MQAANTCSTSIRPFPRRAEDEGRARRIVCTVEALPCLGAHRPREARCRQVAPYFACRVEGHPASPNIEQRASTRTRTRNHRNNKGRPALSAARRGILSCTRSSPRRCLRTRGGDLMSAERTTTGIGWRVYGVGILALGAVCLAFGDFHPGQPVPKDFPARTLLAYAAAVF